VNLASVGSFVRATQIRHPNSAYEISTFALEV
jgi:hypothetical protein